MNPRIPYRMYLSAPSGHRLHSLSCAAPLGRLRKSDRFLCTRRGGEPQLHPGLGRIRSLPHSTAATKTFAEPCYQLRRKWDFEDELATILKDQESLESQHSRTLLYPDSTDPVLVTLMGADSVEQVFQCVELCPNLTTQHACQAVATLQDLQKACGDWTEMFPGEHTTHLREFTETVTGHPTFGMLVGLIENSAHSLSDLELTTVLLCLRRFHIMPWHPSVNSLLCVSLGRVRDFQPSVLAKWCLAVTKPSQTGRLIIPAALPALQRHISQCDSLEDVRWVSTTILAYGTLFNRLEEMSACYLNRISHLLDNGTLDQATPVPDLVRILRSLNGMTRMAHTLKPLPIMIRILGLLENSNQLHEPASIACFTWIRKSWEVANEPVGLMTKIDSLSCELLEHREVRLQDMDLLSQILYHPSLERRQRLEHHLIRLMQSEDPLKFLPYLKPMFWVIRSSLTSNRNVVDRYWNIVLSCLDYVRKIYPRDFVPMLVESALTYLFFNVNSNSSYRLNAFEHHMLKWIDQTSILDATAPVLNVRKFCQLFSFVLAYADNRTPKRVIDKLLEMEEQLGVPEVHHISQGVHVRYNCLRHSHQSYSSCNLVNVSSMLERRTHRLLIDDHTQNLNFTSSLLNSARSRMHPLPSKRMIPLYDFYLQHCESQIDQLCCKFLNDILHFLYRISYLSPRILNRLIAYAVQQKDNLDLSVLVNLSIISYGLGYIPADGIDQLIPTTTHAIMEKGTITGLLILKYALSLMLPNQLTAELVKEIFSVHFLDLLENEILHRFPNTSFPLHVRKTLMELNRAVCIDMPEVGIPWFHDNYCRLKTQTRNHLTTSSFHSEIYRCLKEVVSGGQFIKAQAYSSYYHLIDFELLIQKNERPLIPPVGSSNHVCSVDEERIAVLALPPEYFTVHCVNLKGLHRLHQRQLEILGYRVVGIPYHHWNSLALSNHQAKLNFLRQKLYKHS